MELKRYQKKSMRDLASYLSCLDAQLDYKKAYESHSNVQDVRVGFGGVPTYNDTIPGTPHICFKVPTGGGKTFMACASIKQVFDSMPLDKAKVVAWLVPSNAILEQTIHTLSNPDHPYRQKLNHDFAGRVGIYTKEMLLGGQNFNPTVVRDQLCICVLSYDTLRIDSKNREIRKVYQENSQLAPFKNNIVSPETLLPDVDETALMQVLNQLSPVVVVDESHNTTSPLSAQMLNNLNPAFVLDLTATPRNNSNIISYVDARELKRENMVKLPVVVYNRNSRQSVIEDAIQIRDSIERQAVQEETVGGPYIRPIVLFQAQPKTSEDSETFDKIKALLIDMQIPQEQIAIKTSKVNELKNIDLMSRDCPVRFIITVNALKEGWDCPFAYVLASLANKTSTVDVEQILGRVLRQPYAKKHAAALLNSSYVFTCSSDFRETLEQIVKGLNKAGFSRKDYRIGEELPVESPIVPKTPGEQTSIPPAPAANGPDNYDDIDPKQARETLQRHREATSEAVDKMLEQAQKQAEDYDRKIAQSEKDSFWGGELGEMKNQFAMQQPYRDDAVGLMIPRFHIRTAPSLFGGDSAPLTKEDLSEGFSLSGQDAQINFELATGDMYRVDIAEHGEAVPKYKRTSKEESQFIREYLAKLPDDQKIQASVRSLCASINRNDRLAAHEVVEYVNRVISGMTDDELSALETAVPTYARKIKQKIELLENTYRIKRFGTLLDSGKVFCETSYALPAVITPVNSIDSIDKSLYEAEANDMNGFEFEVLNAVLTLNNIRWWHRIAERKPYEFSLNGFISHYPDFMLMTANGDLILLEAKGDYLWNDESKNKLLLGRKWAANAGRQFYYFMVFKQKIVQADGAYVLDDLISMLKDM